jgi:multiple sugar transport system ATP-binding protein
MYDEGRVTERLLIGARLLGLGGGTAWFGDAAQQARGKEILGIPAERTARYRPYVGRELLFGLRPEHITEPRGATAPEQQEFTVTLDVVEPMGMESMVYFIVDGIEVCGRVDPSAAGAAGDRMRLVADLRHMHLLDRETGEVI